LACSFAWRPRRVVDQQNTWILKLDAARFVKFSQRLFEGFLADAELLPNRFGRTVIIESQPAAVLFQLFHDSVGERRDAFVARGVEAQINLPVGSDIPDETFEPLPNLQWHGEVVPVKEP